MTVSTNVPREIGPVVHVAGLVINLGGHLNTAHARRNPHLVVSVKPGNWDHPINWPAEDVRRLA